MSWIMEKIEFVGGLVLAFIFITVFQLLFCSKKTVMKNIILPLISDISAIMFLTEKRRLKELKKVPQRRKK